MKNVGVHVDENLKSESQITNLLLGAISNPYVLGLVVVSVWNAINDPTTNGISDSARALSYTTPKDCTHK